MLNKLTAFIRSYHMLEPGDRLICAVSGGADSMALLWSMYLLRENLQISLCAAHFNHCLRGEESDRDEAFVRDFCRDYEIPFLSGRGQVKTGKKGLEAAAREARYDFLQSLPGKVATAHNAGDNAETILMHLVRGTGLKGLGGISPVRGSLIRPMLTVTRREILEFLGEYHIPFVEDSTNGSDRFLRNRIRGQVIPILEKENPSLGENLSAMALRLRQDEQALDQLARRQMTDRVSELRSMLPAVESRVLSALLVQWGVREPEAVHVQQLHSLVMSENPSACASFPGGVSVCRCYDRLQPAKAYKAAAERIIRCPGITEIPEFHVRVVCSPSGEDRGGYPVDPRGEMVVRSRISGDTMRLPGGTKSLKKLMIDRKIPAESRNHVAVLADSAGVLAVYGIGGNLDRVGEAPFRVCFEPLIQEETEK